MGLPPVARAYVAFVIAAGVVCLVTAMSRVRLSTENILLFVTLLTTGVATSAAKIELPIGRSQSNLSLSQAVNFWALFAMPPADAVCIAAVSAWAQSTVYASGRNRLHRVLFNISSLVVTVSLAVVPLMWSGLAPDAATAALVRAAALVAPFYFLVNSLLVAGAISLSTRQRIWGTWQQNFLWSAPSYFAGAALAALAHVAWTRGWFVWLALLALPLYLVFRSYDTVVARLRKEQDDTRRAMDVQLATIEALALAIEAKAGCTPEHVRSIQHYAAMLAEAAGMSDAEVQTVRTAALLHDVGNLAVPEHILSKPSALTAEEFERVKIHPRVGAEILGNVPFAGPVNELVLCHHERWDGLGYPGGLRGAEIPLGARVLAIADCFSALQSDRPYRPQRNEAEALAVIWEHSGTAYDPSLVELLTSRLHVGGPVTEQATAPSGELALQDIAGAHREAQTLYEIAQALGSSLGVAEAMALIQQKMSRLIPFVTCALFLGDDEHGYSCRYAHGPGTEALFKSTPKSWNELSLADSRVRGRTRRAWRGSGVRAGVSVAIQRSADWRHRHLSHGRRLLHRRAPARTRARQRSGGRGDLQLNALRADAARVAYRPVDGPGESSLAGSPGRGGRRTRPSRENQLQRRGARPRSAEGDQRHVRPRSRRPRDSFRRRRASQDRAPD
jgi:hypothetical protein